MSSNRFRTIALALRPYLSDTYDILNAAAAVEDALTSDETPDPTPDPWAVPSHAEDPPF